MSINHFLCLALSAAAISVSGCSNTTQQSSDTAQESEETVSQAPQFDADSAYQFTADQCNYGPRVPGTQAHAQCASMLTGRLRSWADSVIVQEAAVTTFDGKHLTAKNIIAQFNPEAEGRILLLAHWDCRPWADKDPDESRRNEPVMGANDAASGTAVLLEVARQLKSQPTSMGVDIVLVDVEDWGNENDDDSWALGTQYWAAHPHVTGYKPLYGILLDMVGARGARFGYEYHSMHFAPSVVQNVWKTAQEAGFGNYFGNHNSGGVTDDHVPINNAGIPCIDIIDMRDTGFFDGWHTTHDTMDCIDRNTLKAVGQTLLNVIYNN